MKKRLLSTLLALCMMLALLPGTARAADSGTCGLDAKWTLESGTLTISGTGRMTDYRNGGDTPWFNQRQEITKIVVGSGITSIGDYAFVSCVQAVNVNLPNSLTAIGYSSFSGCEQLTSITLPNSVKSIGRNAFSRCTKLIKISIPAGVTSIEYCTFDRCSNLKTIDYGGTEAQWNKIWIDSSNYQYLFSSQAKLNYLGSPNTQTVFSGNLGGSNNTAGSKVIWTLGKNGVLTITGSGAMPDSTRPWGWRTADIANISLGSGISRIGTYAFVNCSSLSSVTIPGTVSSIGQSAFYSCTNLTDVIIQDGVTSLDNSAFAYCSSLMSISIPASVLIIGSYAFDGCNRLMDVYYAGTEAQWKDIQNKASFPKECEIHYGSTPPAPVQYYTVTFDGNGGSVPAGSETAVVEEGGVIGTLPRPTRTGYTFDGWYTEGGTKVSTSTKVTSDMTLYAQWTQNAPKTYTVTFDPDGGSVSTTTKTYTEGAALGTLPTPTKSGYDFAGWYTAKTGGTQVTTTTKVTGNQTLYARWTAKPAATKTYTITLNANSGKVSPSSVKVEAGKAYGTLPTPTRTGFTFNGWYTSKIGGTKVASTAKPSKNTTLYAHWTRTRFFLVTFDPNGGDIYQGMKVVVSGGLYGELPTPTRQDYIFKGWYTTKTGSTKVTATKRASLTGNQTLYAKWEKSATAKTTSGKWTVTIPSYYELALYNSADTPKSSKTVNIAEKTGGYLNVTCTKKAVLSTGVVRYYGTVNKTKTWFTYSCEMDVK